MNIIVIHIRFFLEGGGGILSSKRAFFHESVEVPVIPTSALDFSFPLCNIILGTWSSSRLLGK
jgi:hypothetical protein